MADAPTELLNAAQETAKKAYAPYSNFPVGAALLADDEIFVGANLENASYGLSLCAEVGAMEAALTAGKFGKIAKIAVVAGDLPTAPCGRCRQILHESSQLSGIDIEVWCADSELTIIESYKISELLPNAFWKSSIN